MVEIKVKSFDYTPAGLEYSVAAGAEGFVNFHTIGESYDNEEFYAFSKNRLPEEVGEALAAIVAQEDGFEYGGTFEVEGVEYKIIK